MTNFDKVKELWKFDDLLSFQTQICDIIKALRGESWVDCMIADCSKCYKWLQEEYKDEPQE